MLTTVLHSEGEKLQSRVCFALFRKNIARFVPAEPLDSEILPNVIAKMIKRRIGKYTFVKYIILCMFKII